MKNEKTNNKLTPAEKTLLITVATSIGVVILFYLISPKHWLELTIISPYPVIP